jgi:hypothetical protein
VKLHAGRVFCHWSNGLEHLVQKVGVVCRCYFAHVISCGFIVSGQCQDQPDCLYGCMKKYQKKTACTSLREDKHLVIQNTLKTIVLNH